MLSGNAVLSVPGGGGEVEFVSFSLSHQSFALQQQSSAGELQLCFLIQARKTAVVAY